MEPGKQNNILVCLYCTNKGRKSAANKIVYFGLTSIASGSKIFLCCPLICEICVTLRENPKI
jgi:hypothetical protein